MKKRRPIDEGNEVADGNRPLFGDVNVHSKRLRSRRDVIAPVDSRPILARFFQWQEFFPLRLCCVLLSQPLVFFAGLFIELGFEFFLQQRIYYAHRARSVQHVNSARSIVRRDLHRSVRPAGGGAANQERQTKSFALHFLRHMHHLIQ